MSKLLNENDIKDLINDSLLEHDLINQEIYLKCGKPKVVQALPGDLRTTDLEKLNRRKEAIKLRIEELNLQISQKTLDVKTNNTEIKKQRLRIKNNKSKQKEEYQEYKRVSKELITDSKKSIKLMKQLDKELSKKGVTITYSPNYWKGLIDKFINYSEVFKIKADKDFQNNKRPYDSELRDTGYGLTSSLPEKNVQDLFGEFFNLSSERTYIDSNSDKVLSLVDEIYNSGRGFSSKVEHWRNTGFNVEVAIDNINEANKNINNLKSMNEDIKKEIDTLKTQRKQLKDEGKLTDNRISSTHDLAVPGDTYWDRDRNTLYRVMDDGSIGSAPYYGPGASDHLYD